MNHLYLHNKSFLLLFLLSQFLLFSCTNNMNLHVDGIVIDLEKIPHESKSISDLISDVQIIPLTNEKNCMLSSVDKLMVTDKGFLIMDYASAGKVFLFSHNGTFHSQIGELGHGEGEYSYLFDFTTSPECDTIALSTMDGMLIFDSEGKFLFSSHMDNVCNLKQIARVKTGYVCSTNHSGGDFLLQLFDNSLCLKDEFLPTDAPIIKRPPLVGSFLKTTENKIVFCDYFDSSFYVVDADSSFDAKRISLMSKDLLTIDKANNEKNEKISFDYIYGFNVIDNTIEGTISINDHLETFLISLTDETCSLEAYDDWIPEIMDYKDGYYYSIISQDLFMGIVDGKFFRSSYLASLIQKEYASQQWNITDDSNYVILKMKRNITHK